MELRQYRPMDFFKRNQDLTKVTAAVVITFLVFLVTTIGRTSPGYNSAKNSFLDNVGKAPKRFESNRQNFSDMSNGCTNGHFHGPPPVCGGDGCLRTLTGPPRSPPDLSGFTIAKLESMKGPAGKPIGEMHMRAVRLVTGMQWSFGIYGSVGEIGVYDGRPTALMASYMDTGKGERLFVCDIFGDIKHMKIFTNKAKKDVFEKNMKEVGFSLTHESEEKRIRLWQDSSMYLSKTVLLQMELPSFRLYSIDGNHYYPFVLSDLIHVVCVLRDGGIIVMDDVVKNDWEDVTGSIKQYMSFIDSNVVVPLMLVDRKLYLCTSTWYTRYWNYLRSNNVGSKLKLCKITNKRFGVDFTYLESCK